MLGFNFLEFELNLEEGYIYFDFLLFSITWKSGKFKEISMLNFTKHKDSYLFSVFGKNFLTRRKY